jgi:hypothetical protein
MPLTYLGGRGASGGRGGEIISEKGSNLLAEDVGALCFVLIEDCLLLVVEEKAEHSSSHLR